VSDRTHDRLATALRRLLGTRPRTEAPRDTVSPDLGTRLDALQKEVDEVRMRVNALFFAVISVAIGDLVVRAVHP